MANVTYTKQAQRFVTKKLASKNTSDKVNGKVELNFYIYFSDSTIELIMPIALLYMVIIMINNVNCEQRNVA